MLQIISLLELMLAWEQHWVSQLLLLVTLNTMRTLFVLASNYTMHHKKLLRSSLFYACLRISAYDLIQLLHLTTYFHLHQMLYIYVYIINIKALSENICYNAIDKVEFKRSHCSYQNIEINTYRSFWLLHHV